MSAKPKVRHALEAATAEVIEESDEQPADVGPHGGDVGDLLDVAMMLKEAGHQDRERVAGQSRLLSRRQLVLLGVIGVKLGERDTRRA